MDGNINSLPKWAKWKILSLQEEVRELKKKLEISDAPPDDVPVVMRSGLSDLMVLPDETFYFKMTKGNYWSDSFSVKRHYNYELGRCILVSGSDSLQISPIVSNSIFISLKGQHFGEVIK